MPGSARSTEQVPLLLAPDRVVQFHQRRRFLVRVEFHERRFEVEQIVQGGLRLLLVVLREVRAAEAEQRLAAYRLVEGFVRRDLIVNPDRAVEIAGVERIDPFRQLLVPFTCVLAACVVQRSAPATTMASAAPRSFPTIRNV